MNYKNIYIQFAFIIALISSLFPSSLLANADKIFKENNKAVVVVVAYNAKGEPISQGSGFIARPDGAVITNYHVISNAVDIAVKAGNKVLKVEGLLHVDKENDLVILKAKGKNLPSVKIGDIAKMNIGEKVYVISSPEGLENTISDGILSGIREITSDKKILQITAPISPGSSGGPVFNKNGEVIGIATFLIKEAQNLNFAMPVNIIKDKINSKKITALKDAGIEDYEKSAEYWLNLGNAYAEVGFYNNSIDAYKQAIEVFKQAIRIKPDYAEAYNNLGVAYGQLGMYREEIESCKQAIRIKPDYAVAYINLGVAYNGLYMYREAMEAFKQAIRIKPDYAKAHYNLGVLYGELGKYREAVEVYKQVIIIKPDLAEAHYNLGVIYDELGMYREEIEAYKQAIRIKPDYAEAHYNLGVIYGKLGMYREAVEVYKQAIKSKPDYAKAHFGLGAVYLQLNDRGAALEEYKILKTLDPDMANKLFNLIY